LMCIPIICHQILLVVFTGCYSSNYSKNVTSSQESRLD